MASESKAGESKDSGDVPDKEAAVQWLAEEGFDPELPRSVL